MRYFIVDDDRASRIMLSHIINESNLEQSLVRRKTEIDAIPQILMIQPDFVLIDLLMPKLDGIETIERLHENGFEGTLL